MTIIQHTNVDGYMDVRFEYKTVPTREQLVKSLTSYHDQDEAEQAADDLLSCGEACLNDSSSTQYVMETL